MVAGNYMDDFVGFRIFWKSNRAVWKPRRPDMGGITAHLLAGAIQPSKFIRKSFSGAMVGLMAVDGAKLWKIMKGCIWHYFAGVQFQCENVATRIFKIHMTGRYGLVVKPFQVIFYQPGCFAKMMAGNYIRDFAGFTYLFEIQPRSFKTPPSRQIWLRRTFLAGTTLPGKFVKNNFSGTMVRPMAVDDAKLWKIIKFASDISFCEQFQREHFVTRMFKMQMTCRYGLVVKRFQVIFYQPGVFCKNDGR